MLAVHWDLALSDLPQTQFALSWPATFPWPKAKKVPQAPCPRAGLPFKSPSQVEQRETAVILLIQSAPDIGRSPVGCWATVQLVLLSKHFVIGRAGIFFQEAARGCQIWERCTGTESWADVGSGSHNMARGGLCRCHFRKMSVPWGGDPPVIL